MPLRPALWDLPSVTSSHLVELLERLFYLSLSLQLMVLAVEQESCSGVLGAVVSTLLDVEA
jgi:hypothetical protein